MNEALESAIEAGIRILQQKRELPEGVRWHIYAALGPRWECPNDLSFMPSLTTVGHRRRVHLALNSVRKVLPLWAEQIAWIEQELERFEQESQSDGNATPFPSVFRLEEVVARLLEGQLAVDDAVHYGQDLWSNGDEANGYDVGYCASGPLYAASKAVFVAVGDEDFKENVSYDFDRNPDPYDWDTAYCASRVFSCAEIGKEQDPEKPVEFWTWWLTEAVPEAYNSEPEPPG